MTIANIIYLLGYMSPSIVGWFRKTPNFGLLLACNLLLGWTIVGWFLAWNMVFPSLLGWFFQWLAGAARNNAGMMPQGAARPMGNFGADAGTGSRPCSTCGASGQERCSYCQGRGSWYTQPQTATDVAQLVTCSHCGASGKVTCHTCGGTGRQMI